jgi:hypothetical protein
MNNATVLLLTFIVGLTFGALFDQEIIKIMIKRGKIPAFLKKSGLNKEVK